MVTEIITRENSYHEAFRALQESQPNSPGLWLKRLRESAMESFQELGFPSVKDEEWKYTNVAPIARIEFKPATLTGVEPSGLDRKSTRLNSSHLVISYAVFCLKKKKITRLVVI